MQTCEACGFSRENHNVIQRRGKLAALCPTGRTFRGRATYRTDSTYTAPAEPIRARPRTMRTATDRDIEALRSALRARWPDGLTSFEKLGILDQ